MIPGGASFEGIHTYDNLGMIPKSKLTFAPPPPRMQKKELPGASGELDYTDSVGGVVSYENRKGSFSFLVPTADIDYLTAYHNIRTYFDGSVRECALDDAPDFIFRGRFWLSGWESWDGFSEATIEYSVEPYRYSDENAHPHDWLWDEMSFSSNEWLVYSSFNVNKKKARTLFNPLSVPCAPSVTCSSVMRVTVNGGTYKLYQGYTRQAPFTLQPGTTYAVFKGTGTVWIETPSEVKP